jgi:hypothetical protein
MFEKVGRLAEAAATKVSLSRRGFLGRLGRGALALTGVLGGLLALPKDARAGGSYVCCKYKVFNPYGHHLGAHFVTICLPPGSTCPPYGGFVNQTAVASCDSCK